MKQISITDVTIKQSGKNAGYQLSFREKIELAKLLDKLRVDVIELNPIENVKVDSLLIKSVCSAVKESAVAVPVGMDECNIDAVWAAMGEAKHPRLQVQLPVSAVQMEYLAGKKPAAMLELIGALVAKCKSLCPDVEFVAEDATRSDMQFLSEAIKTAVAAGATTVTVCDTAGTSLPAEFSEFVENITANIPELETVRLGVCCSDSLSMADGCAVASIRGGAVEIKAAAYGDMTVSLANIVKIISAKADVLDTATTVNATQIKRITDQIDWMCRTNRSKNSPFDSGVQSEGEAYLSEHDDLSAVAKAVALMGYELSDEDNVKVFEAFQKIAAKKKTVSEKELDAIVASAALQVPPTYKLDSYVINTGNIISATANVKMAEDGKMTEGISLGDGPIDAAFLAIEQIVGRHFELDDFQIQAVTEGREAMGESIVKLRSSGKLYSGRGISTDIIGASINAYINALNKIVYEEKEN